MIKVSQSPISILWTESLLDTLGLVYFIEPFFVSMVNICCYGIPSPIFILSEINSVTLKGKEETTQEPGKKLLEKPVCSVMGFGGAGPTRQPNDWTNALKPHQAPLAWCWVATSQLVVAGPWFCRCSTLTLIRAGAAAEPGSLWNDILRQKWGAYFVFPTSCF